MRGKTHIFPVETLKNFSVSFQVNYPFNFGPGVGAIPLTNAEPLANATATTSGWGTTTPGGSLASHSYWQSTY